jgi:hypothetical protein
MPNDRWNDAIDHSEYENSSEEERADTVRAVKEALDDMHDGDYGIPAREFLAEVRQRHNLPELS